MLALHVSSHLDIVIPLPPLRLSLILIFNFSTATITELFGFYMLTIGILMLIIYRATSGHIKKMAAIFKEDKKFVEKFKEAAGFDGVSISSSCY